MSKRLLLTGAGGFVGSHTLEHFLLNTDWEIICIDSFRHKGISERITDTETWKKEEYRNRVQVFTHDLTAPISSVLRSMIGAVDYIIAMASESHVDRSISDPVPFVQNNVNLALTMLEYAREVKPEKFILISTDEVHGAAMPGEKHKEWDAIIPSSPYAGSKACQEAIATSYWRTYGVPVIITNCMNLFGERQDAEKYVPKIMRSILCGNTVTVHGTEDNIGSRFYLHARNCADALLFLLENAKPGYHTKGVSPRPNRFNIVGEKEVNNLEMAKLVAQFIGKALKYELVDAHKLRPGHDRRYALCGERLKRWGWQPPMDLESSLRKTVEWTLANKKWLGHLA